MRHLLAVLTLGTVTALTPAAAMADDNWQGYLHPVPVPVQPVNPVPDDMTAAVTTVQNAPSESRLPAAERAVSSMRKEVNTMRHAMAVLMLGASLALGASAALADDSVNGYPASGQAPTYQAPSSDETQTAPAGPSTSQPGSQVRDDFEGGR